MPILHWLTKNDDVAVSASAPYRLIEDDSNMSIGDLRFGNMLCWGDNL